MSEECTDLNLNVKVTLDKRSIAAGRHPIFAEGFGGMGQMQVEKGGGRGQTRENERRVVRGGGVVTACWQLHIWSCLLYIMLWMFYY